MNVATAIAGVLASHRRGRSSLMRRRQRGAWDIRFALQSDTSAEEAVFPLALITPRQAGTSPSQIDVASSFPANHYILYACQGDVYEFYIRAKDGAWPFRYALSNAPEGMVVNENTGHVTWTVPAVSNGTQYTPTAIVTDAEDNSVSEPWTITVDSTRFRFFSGTGDDVTGDGSRTNPWRSMSKLRSSMLATQIAKFYNGTYSFAGMYTNSIVLGEVDTSQFAPSAGSYEVLVPSNPSGQTLIYETGVNAGLGHLVNSATNIGGNRWRITSVHSTLTAGAPSDGDLFAFGNTWQRLEWASSTHCTQWIAVHGQSPVLDFGFTGFRDNWGALQRFNSNSATPAVVRGFDLQHFLDKAFQTTPGHDYIEFQHLTCGVDSFACAIEGSNPGCIMNVAAGPDTNVNSSYKSIHTTNTKQGALKLYVQDHPVIEDCDATDCAAAWDVKASINRFDIRDCVFVGNADEVASGLHGNMSGTTNGVFRFCLIDTRDTDGATPLAARVGQGPIETLRDITFVRCTLIGRVQVENMTSPTGPTLFRHCVIINTDSSSSNHVLLVNSDVDQVEFDENLYGLPSDNIVDADGNLQGSFTSYLGTRGYQLA